jgi:hypothetical protein
LLTAAPLDLFLLVIAAKAAIQCLTQHHASPKEKTLDSGMRRNDDGELRMELV